LFGFLVFFARSHYTGNQHQKECTGSERGNGFHVYEVFVLTSVTLNFQVCFLASTNGKKASMNCKWIGHFEFFDG
jgi:hypothetical protein